MAQNPRRVANTFIIALAAGLAWSPIANARQTAPTTNLAQADTQRLLNQQHSTELGQGPDTHDLHHRIDEYEASLASSTPPATEEECINHDAPNPVYQQWPENISGNLNGTTMIIPITMEAARKAIPSEYGILEEAWQEWLPGFPQGMYPMMAVAVHDHDLRFPAYNVTTPDFSRTALEFPFVDVLNDGYSSFRWAANMLISSNTPAAIQGSESYGINVHPATFDPPCNAYRSDAQHPGTAIIRAWSESPSSGDNTSGSGSGNESGSSTPATKCPSSRDSSNSNEDEGEEEEKEEGGKPWLHAPFSLSFTTTPLPESPYPLNFLVNITNQPVFADPKICDNYKRLFNTTLTTDPANAPVAVQGTVKGKLEPFAEGGMNVWEGVFGWRLATAFLEPPVPGNCEALKGYMGTGKGDSAQL